VLTLHIGSSWGERECGTGAVELVCTSVPVQVFWMWFEEPESEGEAQQDEELWRPVGSLKGVGGAGWHAALPACEAA